MRVAAINEEVRHRLGQDDRLGLRAVDVQVLQGIADAPAVRPLLAPVRGGAALPARRSCNAQCVLAHRDHVAAVQLASPTPDLSIDGHAAFEEEIPGVGASIPRDPRA